MKSKLRLNSLIISFIVSLVVAGLYWQEMFVNFENKSLDWRFQVRGVELSSSTVVIAAIDDKALQEVGKWPWPRKIHGKLIDVFRKAGASAVVFDVVFYEPDRYDPSNDRALETAIKRNGRVISAFDFKISEDQMIEKDAQGTIQTVSISTVVQEIPIENVVRSSRELGFVNCFPDGDGYLRRAPLLYEYEGETFHALNILAVSVAQGKSVGEIMEGLPVTNAISWNYPSKEVLINYRGPQEKTFTTYSCADLLGGAIPPEWLKDKIILIGSTALGLYDHYPTPFSASFPGLYFHANVIDNLLSRDFLVPVSTLVTFFMIFAFGIGGGLFVPRVSAWMGAVASILFTIGFWAVGYFLMVKKLVYLELIAPTLSIMGSYVSVFFYRFIVEQKEKAGIKKAFGVYVNPHVVDQIAKNPDGLKLGGEMREMTVMFSDVAGFTSISEKLTPQELVQLLNLYLTAMTDTIMKYDGTVDKYEGDAIMAFWGAPLLQPDHAKKACTSILENRQRLAELNAELEKKGMHKLSARCGLNSGSMNVGNMGSSQKFNYTVMGDAVNLASRLEGANKQYGTYLMISETTYALAKDEIEVRELDLLRVKGKNVPIKVFELVAKKGELSDNQKKGFELFTEALVLYRKRHFKEALKKFEHVNEFLPEDPPSGTYMKRAHSYIESPPDKDWDGVFVMTTK